jgi:hypothetical protein
MSSYRKTMGEAYNGMYLVEGNIDKIKDIVSKKSASKIDGVTVDMFTASAISQIYDKVNDANKKKMEKLPITKLAALAMKMMKNEYVPEELDLDEGTWHKAKDMSGLKKLMKKPILLGKDGDGATAAIAPYIGDDELYDDLFDAGKKDGPKADARPLIKNAMQRLGIKEEVELDEKLDKDDETVVKKVVDKLKKASQAHAGQSKDLQKAIDEDGHTDVVSAQNNVKVAMSALTKMSGELAKLSPEDALPSWWTNKVAVAVDKLDGMADYLDTQVEEVELGERLDPADVDDDATDDDIKSADKNIMMQLRKSISLRGNFPVEFMDKKKIRVPAKVAQAVQSKYNSLRKPNDKEKFQSQIAKSYKDMLGAIKEAVSPAQQAAIAISKKERGEKPKKESRFNTINKQLKGEK